MRSSRQLGLHETLGFFVYLFLPTKYGGVFCLFVLLLIFCLFLFCLLKAGGFGQDDTTGLPATQGAGAG